MPNSLTKAMAERNEKQALPGDEEDLQCTGRQKKRSGPMGQLPCQPLITECPAHVFSNQPATSMLIRTGLTTLKNTQVYPPAFGKAIAVLYSDHKKEVEAGAIPQV